MDSLKTLSVNNSSHQRLHALAPKSGHIHKGHSFVSPYATIPSKYETYVIENKEKCGFSSAAPRFNYEQNENIFPGIGYYDSGTELKSVSPSYSKHGTGSFASKNRFQSKNVYADNPAPNIYDISDSLFNKNCSTVGVSANFHTKIAQTVDDKNSKLPAPNAYNIDSTAINESNHNILTSSFRSKTNRNVNVIDDKPGPGQYTVNKADNLMSHFASGVQSAFKSKTVRGLYKEIEGPGPTQYDVARDLKSTQHDDKLKQHKNRNQKHYLCLAARALALPPTPPLPGPGQYNISTTMAVPRHFMSSSMFTSGTSRWTRLSSNYIGIGISNPTAGGGGAVSAGTKAGASGFTGPSPTQYQPVKPKKQSFHYNIDNRWM